MDLLSDTVHHRKHLTGCLVGVDKPSSAIVVSGIDGIDMILVIDHDTSFSPSDLKDRWQSLRPGITLSIIYSLADARWVADQIAANSPNLPCSPPPPSREGDTSTDELGGFHSKRTRRLTGTTGPTGTIRGVITAVDSICQSFLVHPISGAKKTEVLVAIDNETSLHHGSERALFLQLNRGSEVLVKYLEGGALNIAQDIDVGEVRQAPDAAKGATPPYTGVPPQGQALGWGDFVRQSLAAAAHVVEQRLTFGAADAAAIKARTGWTPSEGDVKVYLGRDMHRGLVGLAVLVWVSSEHGPIGVAVAFDPSGMILQATVVNVRPLFSRDAMAVFTGLPLDGRPDPAKLSAGAKSRDDADVIAQGVERAQAVARVSLVAAAR